MTIQTMTARPPYRDLVRGRLDRYVAAAATMRTELARLITSGNEVAGFALVPENHGPLVCIKCGHYADVLLARLGFNEHANDARFADIVGKFVEELTATHKFQTSAPGYVIDAVGLARAQFIRELNDIARDAFTARA